MKLTPVQIAVLATVVLAATNYSLKKGLNVLDTDEKDVQKARDEAEKAGVSQSKILDAINSTRDLKLMAEKIRSLINQGVTALPTGTTVYDKTGNKLATTTATTQAVKSTYCAPPLLWDWGKGKCMSRDEIANIPYTYSEAAKQAEVDVNKNINKGAKIVTGLDYNAIYAANPEIAPPVMVSNLSTVIASNAPTFTYNSNKLNGIPYGYRGLNQFLRRRGLRL